VNSGLKRIFMGDVSAPFVTAGDGLAGSVIFSTHSARALGEFRKTGLIGSFVSRCDERRSPASRARVVGLGRLFEVMIGPGRNQIRHIRCVAGRA
jgi:hypothetical protein